MVKPVKTPAARGIPLHANSIEYWGSQQKQLRRDIAKWNQFRSSLDAIRQTHRAIEAYNHSNGNLNEDQRFLAIYGLLQALVVQQDAMCHLAEALGTTPVHMARHKRLEEIRNIRNWTVGHPTKIDRYETRSHHAIQRPQLGRGGFSLYSAFDDGREQYTYVPMLQLARLQRRIVSRLLRGMLAELNSLQVQKQQRRKKQSVAVRIPAIRPQAAPPERLNRLGSNRQTRKRGIAQQSRPQFMKPARPHKKSSGKKNSFVPPLMPLPGERFGRHRPAA